MIFICQSDLSKAVFKKEEEKKKKRRKGRKKNMSNEKEGIEGQGCYIIGVAQSTA